MPPARSPDDRYAGDLPATVYIDGLNLYAAAFRGTVFKWADMLGLAKALIPTGFVLADVKYFTAVLHHQAAEDPASVRRQRIYLKALSATGVDVRQGTFVVPTRWRTFSPKGTWADRLRPEPDDALAASLAQAEAATTRPWKARVVLPEEKFTDVAIGVELVDDFHRGQCALAVLVTNDADLAPAIDKTVQQQHRVHVVSPAATINKALRASASSASVLDPDLRAIHQLPDEFTIRGAKHSKPAAWKARK